MIKDMKWIVIKIMKMMLLKAKNDMFSCDNHIVRRAYENMIENYETTIMYLKANDK